jgi:ribonuclease HII
MDQILTCQECGHLVADEGGTIGRGYMYGEEFFCSEICVEKYKKELAKIEQIKNLKRSDRTAMIQEIFQELRQTEWSLGVSFLERMTNKELLEKYETVLKKSYGMEV